MADKVIVTGGGAGSVFWGLVLFFIVMPVVCVLGCFACTGAVIFTGAKTVQVAAEQGRAALKKEEEARRHEQAKSEQEMAESSAQTTLLTPAELLINPPANAMRANVPPVVVPEEKPPVAEPPTTVAPEPPKKPNATARKWKSQDGGFTVDAVFVGSGFGKVKLRKTDGTVISVPIEKLSDDDQDYIKNRGKKGAD